MTQHALIMLLAGIGIPTLAALNAALGKHMGSPAAAATILFLIALITALVATSVTGPQALARVAGAPRHLLLGGVWDLGVVPDRFWQAMARCLHMPSWHVPWARHIPRHPICKEFGMPNCDGGLG